MKERLKEIIKNLAISYEEFAVEVGVSADLIRRYLRGAAVVSEAFIRKLKKAYPELNIDWFENGQGEMYLVKTPGKEIHEDVPEYKTETSRLIENLQAHIDDQKLTIEEYKSIIKEQRRLIDELRKRK